MQKRPLPIGIEFYKDMMKKPYYYVDKTLMIKDILDKGGKVNLFTRPRRFGKTLGLSMLRTFFERETDKEGLTVDNSSSFKGTKILKAGEQYISHMGQYPVISLSLKSAKQPNFQMAYESLIDEIIKEYNRHSYILSSDCLTEEYRNKYIDLMNRKAGAIAYAKALVFLTDCLRSYHNQNVIILIDEYDVPLENSYFRGFYYEMTDFIRSLFESALKTNEFLEFAVITGCLRISRESIFTGLNNLKILSVLDESFAEYFGFTQSEVKAMLDYYEIGSREEEVKQWYDGYLFGQTEVYNPWSVINYVDDIISRNTQFPKPYWSNTSSNSIVRELVDGADDTVKTEIENLIAGGLVEKPVHEEVTYGEIHKSQDNLWNFLFFTGYLKAVSRKYESDSIYLTLTIPNTEIRYIYRNTIREWFEERQKGYDATTFYEGMRTGDCEKIEEFINNQLLGSISYYDSTENFYHGYLLGILGGIGGYRKIFKYGFCFCKKSCMVKFLQTGVSDV